MASKTKSQTQTQTQTQTQQFTHVQACIKSDDHVVFVIIDGKYTFPRGKVIGSDFKKEHAYLNAIRRIFETKVGAKFPELKNFKINDFYETRTYIGECKGFGGNFLRIDSPFYDMMRVKIEYLFDPKYEWDSRIHPATWETLKAFQRNGHLN